MATLYIIIYIVHSGVSIGAHTCKAAHIIFETRHYLVHAISSSKDISSEAVEYKMVLFDTLFNIT